MTEKNNIKSKRVMNYFIDACLDIITEEGLNNATIRKVASRSGYTSGSIYRYFDSIDDLIGFAGVRSLIPITNLFKEIDDSAEDVFEVFYIITYLAFDIILLYSQIYYEILELNNIKPSKYFEKYYKIFPEDRVDISERINNTFFTEVKRDAAYVMTNELVENGIFSQDEALAANNVYDIFIIGSRMWHLRDPKDENVDFMHSNWRNYLSSLNPDLISRFDSLEKKANKCISKYKDDLKK